MGVGAPQSELVTERVPVRGGIEVTVFEHDDGLALAGITGAKKRIEIVDGGQVGRHDQLITDSVTT